MPAPGHDTNTQLPIDEGIETLLELVDQEAENLDETTHDLRQIDSDRLAYGMARALQALIRRDEEYARQWRMIADEIAIAREKLTARIEFLEGHLEDLAREYRDGDRGKTMELVGVGNWATRTINSRWDIDNNAMVNALTGDDRERFTEEPPPPGRKLKGPEFRAHLDVLLTQTLATIDEEQREAKTNDLGEALTKGFPEGAVKFIPAKVGVRHDLRT